MSDVIEEEGSILDWVWGTIQGDFNEDPSVGQLITNAVITAIPLVDQVADARDLTANIKALVWDKRYDDFTVWLGFFFTLIGLIPTVGSLLKGVLKLVWKSSKLDEVLKFFNAFMKGNGVRWLKELRAGKLKQYSQDAAKMAKEVIDSVSSTIKEAMEYVPSWAGNLYQKMQDVLNVLREVRSRVDDMFSKVTAELEQKLDDLLKQNVDNTAEGSSKSTLMVKQEADEVPVRSKERDAELRAKKAVPSSLVEAEEILKNRRKEIAASGYQPKYSDADLQELAKTGDIGSDRFQARFMETKYLVNRDTPNTHLSGAMGATMEGASGKGAKYWSTSFDQIEDADTDPKLIAEKLGLTYNPEADYTLVVVDTNVTTPLTGTKSVSATFENVSDFANTELPGKFPTAFTDKAMTPEFQAEYSKHYKAADKSGAFEKKWSAGNFEKYLDTTDLSAADKKLMKQRFQMHGTIGNNEDYLGNGLTKNNNPEVSQEYGAVETLNFERKEINLDQLNQSNALKIIPGLTTI